MLTSQPILMLCGRGGGGPLAANVGVPFRITGFNRTTNILTGLQPELSHVQ